MGTVNGRVNGVPSGELHDIIIIDGMTYREARERRGKKVSEGTKYSVTWVAAPVVWEVWIEDQW